MTARMNVSVVVRNVLIDLKIREEECFACLVLITYALSTSFIGVNA